MKIKNTQTQCQALNMKTNKKGYTYPYTEREKESKRVI